MAMYYDQNTEAIDDTLTWAEMFENSKARIIGQTVTLYGEKLSTVWLGIDHQWGDGPPLIFETMLFAPRQFKMGFLVDNPEEREAWEREDAWVKIHYPHDQLQQRYTWKDDARADFEKLRLQCLIPPRWRRFIFYKIFKDGTWS